MANVQNVVAILVIPEQPKSLPNQQIFVYTNKSDILNIISGDTIVGAAHKDDQGNNIANSFANIINGTTKVGAAQEADHADTADNATNAATADKAIKDGNNENIADHFDTVEGDISTVDTKATNAGNTATEANDRSIANAGEIATLKSIVRSGENYIGTLTLDHTPTSADLNAFVFDEVGRAPQGNDMVIVVEQITGATDKTYKYLYKAATSSWGYFEIPSFEKASNGTAGIVSGTYGVKNYNTLVNIIDGEIQNIYIKVNGNYLDIRDFVLENKDDITKITNGTTVVAEALKATQDALGNNIVNTYLTKAAGATKQYVKDYAMPRQFNDVFYLATAGFSEEIPTTPVSGIQFSATSSAIGETKLAECDYELGDVKFQLARKNSYTARYYVAASTDTGETLQFKLETYAVINGIEVLLHSELTTPKLIPSTLEAFDFGDAFAELGNTVLEMETGDKIRQKLYVVREDSNTVTFDVYSNSTYPSSFYLNTTLEVGIMMIRRASEAFTLYENGWTADADIAPYGYSAELQLPFELDDNSYVELIIDPIIAVKYGIVIGAASGDTVKFYSIKLPTEDILLKLIIDNLGTLNELEDNYRWGYMFYLRNANVEQVDDELEVEE